MESLKKIDWRSALLIIWVVVTFLYIANNIWHDFKIGTMQNAYIAGKTDTVNELLDQASNKECKPFNVYAWDRKADLINIICLQQAQKESDMPSSPTVPKK